MNERLTKIKTDSTNFWSSRTKKQKGAIFGALIAIIAFASVLTYFSTRTEMVPMYTGLSQAEVGKIQEVLAADGVTYEITPGGTNILVPAKQADALKVSLATQGFPQSGGISTSFFAENAGFGMTDNEFDVLKLAALETEVADLLKQVAGVNGATVKITLPKQGVFLPDGQGESTAAVILTTAPGQQFTDENIRALYGLVEKSVPNLTPENIRIANQYAERYDLDAAVSGNGSVATPDGQMQFKKAFERDLQREVQSLLGTLVGPNNVLVSITSDIDFKQENRQENLVEPVDEETMSGIAISAQRITETYTGTGATATGTPEAGQVTDNFTDYVEGAVGNGDYERTEEKINNDVNRIHRAIQEAPYKIRDIGAVVAVDLPEDMVASSEEIVANITEMLNRVIRTSIDKEAGGDLSDEELANKIFVTVQPFLGNNAVAEPETSVIPWWVWVIGGVLLVAIALLVFFILRSRKRQEEEELSAIEEQQEKIIVEDIADEKETEATVRRKQLEKMAKEKPDDFAKLLRSWIAED
ncbi:flagellar basal-body MS-ring/collar protein FliF [Metasolibacillus meyeri]|uniref:flagellar basal-body MS-ring/collar protein FliF n=1 Tax=Metasolibacillus meyeri TaxID=1071052 RepID=UPI000D31B825|nr:flagellar basal-body MS-ring/collar protein FliF [Metasolibacillus meyeri]